MKHLCIFDLANQYLKSRESVCRDQFTGKDIRLGTGEAARDLTEGGN